MSDVTDDYARGVRDGVARCAKMLRDIAAISKDDYAKTFMDLAESWDPTPMPPKAPLPLYDTGLDFGEF